MSAIVCVADLRLDSQLDAGALRVLEGAARQAREGGARAFVSCGGLFVDEHVTRGCLVQLVRLLGELAPIPVLLIPGECDPVGELSPYDDEWAVLAGWPQLGSVGRVTTWEEAAAELGVEARLLRPPKAPEEGAAPRVARLDDEHPEPVWSRPPELPEVSRSPVASLELPETANGRSLAVALADAGAGADVEALLAEVIEGLSGAVPATQSSPFACALGTRIERVGKVDLTAAPADRLVVLSTLDPQVADGVDELRAGAGSALAEALVFPGTPRVPFPLERAEVDSAVTALAMERGGDPPLVRLLARLDELAPEAQAHAEHAESGRSADAGGSSRSRAMSVPEELRELRELLTTLEDAPVQAAADALERATAEILREAGDLLEERAAHREREGAIAAEQAEVAGKLTAQPRMEAHDEEGWIAYLERAEELAACRAAARALQSSVEEEERRLGGAGVDLQTALAGASRLGTQGADARRELRGRLESRSRHDEAVTQAEAAVQAAALELERRETAAIDNVGQERRFRQAMVGVAGASGAAAALTLAPWVTGGICVASLGAALLRRNPDGRRAERSARDPLTDAQQRLAAAERTRANSREALRSLYESAGFASLEELQAAFEHHARLRELVELQQRQAAATARVGELEAEIARALGVDVTSPTAARLEEVRSHLQLLRRGRRLERDRAASVAEGSAAEDRRRRVCSGLRARIATLAGEPLDAYRREARARGAAAKSRDRVEARSKTVPRARTAVGAALAERLSATLEPAERALDEWCARRLPELGVPYLSDAAGTAFRPEPQGRRGGAGDLLAVLASAALASTLWNAESLPPLVLEDCLALLDDSAVTAALTLLAESVAPGRQVLLATSQPERLRQLGADCVWSP